MKTPLRCCLGWLAGVLGLTLSASAQINPGLELWSVRAQMRSDPSAALDLVSHWGINEVETADTGIPPIAQLASLLQSHYLNAVSAHFGYQHLRDHLPDAVHQAQLLGVKFAICSAARPGHGVFDAAAAREVATQFNSWGEAFRRAGIQFGYHAHGTEFGRVRAGSEQTPFDILVEQTDPDLVCYEMDVFWVFHAGQDPVKLLAKYPHRWRLLHLKDIRHGAAVGAQDGKAPIEDFVPMGTGQIDWPAVLGEAQAIGVKHYFIEDEGVDPLQSIPVSLRYLQHLALAPTRP